ncbi:MAG: LolA-related protein [Rhizomicrobium sp.]
MSVTTRLTILAAVFGCFMIGGIAHAAAPAPSGASAVTVRAGEVLRGHFIQTRHMSGFAKPLKSEGSFTIAPQYGLIWTVTKPLRSATVITESGLVQSNNGVETLNLSARKMPFIAQLHDMIAGMLTGDVAAMQQKFTLTQQGTPQSWRIRLVPRKANDAMMPFKEIRAHGGRFVEEVTMVRSDGDSDVLSFDGVTLATTTLTAAERASFHLSAP